MTRPLTLRDRCPEPGDLVTTCCRIDPLTVTEVFPLVRVFRVMEIGGLLSFDAPWYYIRRRDGGHVEVAREAGADSRNGAIVPPLGRSSRGDASSSPVMEDATATPQVPPVWGAQS